MSRKKDAGKKNTVPDSKYSSELVAKMINYVMYQGKKAKAEGIVYASLRMLSARTEKDAVHSFEQVVDSVKPQVEVKSKRVGGSTYQIPVEIRPERRVALAMKWLINASRKRKSEKDIVGKLSGEMFDAFCKKGMAYKKKEDTHKIAESNKAFAHYRW